MKKKNNIHSIILARGGSKGIKNKNLKLIKDKPLIFWSIKKSLKSKKINYTWVSSDSEKILKYAKKNGALIIKRPKSLSSDTSSSEAAWLHAAEYVEKNGYKIDTIVGIQPTSPIRISKDFDSALDIFYKKKLDSLFSSTIINDFFVWKKNKLGKLTPNYNYKKRKRRQNIKDNFLENGSFFIFNKKKFIKYKCRLFGTIGTYNMPKSRSFQIDDFDDLNIINQLAKKFL